LCQQILLNKSLIEDRVGSEDPEEETSIYMKVVIRSLLGTEVEAVFL